MGRLLLISAGAVTNFIYKVGIIIDTVVYWLTAKAYEVFLLVSESQLFDSGSAMLAEVTERIYSVLGIAMLFVLAYNIIKLIVNPDKFTSSDDSSLQGIAKNLVISIIILTLLPTAFKYIYRFQDRVLKTNVLANIVLGGVAESGEFTIKSAGRDVATTIFSSFLHPVDSEGNIYTASQCQTSTDPNKPAICDEYVSAMYGALDNNKISSFINNDHIINAIGDEVSYIWPISLVAGVIAAYLFISFAIDLGVRVVKLGVLQLVAPVPVIMRVTKPKGGIFDKWFKETTKTYLMVFERLLVIYFSVFVLQIICSDNGGIIANLSQNGKSETGDLVTILAKVILILGTLKFAKDAPKLLEDLFGTKLSGFSIKKKLNDNEYAKRALVGAGTGTLSFGTNLFRGKPFKALLSAPKGIMKGWKNGNIKDISFSGLGNAITQSRVETTQDVDKLRENILHPVTAVKDKTKKTVEKVGTFLSGESEKNIQLDTAKALETMFKTLFESFEDKNIKSAMESALKDFYAGKDVILPNDLTRPVQDGNGNQVFINGEPQFETVFEAGKKIAVQDLIKEGFDEKDIKSQFNDMQMEKLASKFNMDEFKEAIADHGKNIIKELEKSRDIMGTDEETRKRIDINISELKKIFKSDENGQINFNTESIKKIQEVNASISDNVKSLAFQAKTKKDAEGKK